MSLLVATGGVELSPDCAYRYHLWRRIGPEPANAAFVMLNPSTADAEHDDPTIRRCISFARRHGCGRLDVVNLYAYRATDPLALRDVADPVGPQNDDTIRRVIGDARLLVVAWGSWPGPTPGRVRTVRGIIGRAGGQPLCLGTTQDGSPRHPLYVRGDTTLEVWR